MYRRSLSFDSLAPAARTGQDTAQVIQEAVDRLLDHDAWFAQEVEKGQSQVAKGELIDHDELVARIEKRLREKQPRS